MLNKSNITNGLFLVVVLLLLTIAAFSQTSPTRIARVNGATAGQQRPGSVLIYNAYTSDATTTNANTQINLTNTNATAAVSAHLFFIADDCHIADAFICLTANQTASFLVSDVDPGTNGYLIAIASEFSTGCPIGFNFLVGSEEVKFKSGHAASLPAESFQALFSGTLPGCVANAAKATLNFDGRVYSPAPGILALNNIPSRADNNDSLLIVNTFSGALDRPFREPVGLYSGLLYDDAENVVSFSLATQNCQLRGVITNTFPRTVPRVETFIPAGRTGLLQLTAFNNTAITGAVINLNSKATVMANAFNGGYNLHHLNYIPGQLMVTVFPPSC